MGGPGSGVMLQHLEVPHGAPAIYAKKRFWDLLPKALQTLDENMSQTRDIRVRQQAAEYIVDRNLGKPAQAVEVTGRDRQPLRISVLYDLTPRLAGVVTQMVSRPEDDEQGASLFSIPSCSKDESPISGEGPPGEEEHLSGSYDPSLPRYIKE